MTSDEQKLLQVFRDMSPEQQAALQDYADFLVARDRTATDVAEAAAPAEPVDIPRPEEESVIEAVRRLSETYPMIDKEVLLHETTDLVSQHLTQGRPVEEVIDELQALFEKHYQSMKG